MAVDTRDFVPQRAIVTGSESGIGRAIAVALADLGCDVGVTWYRDEEMGKETGELVRAAGRRAELAHVDLLRSSRAADVVDRARGRPRRRRRLRQRRGHRHRRRRSST